MSGWEEDRPRVCRQVWGWVAVTRQMGRGRRTDMYGHWQTVGVRLAILGGHRQMRGSQGQGQRDCVFSCQQHYLQGPVVALGNLIEGNIQE